MNENFNLYVLDKIEAEDRLASTKLEAAGINFTTVMINVEEIDEFKELIKVDEIRLFPILKNAINELHGIFEINRAIQSNKLQTSGIMA